MPDHKAVPSGCRGGVSEKAGSACFFSTIWVEEFRNRKVVGKFDIVDHYLRLVEGGGGPPFAKCAFE